MCRNHSHLIATFVGENTQGEVPVLMFVLADPVLIIEAPTKDGSALKLRTSGMVFVPSSMLAGLSAFQEPATAGLFMSLFFSLDSVPTITAQIATDLRVCCETSTQPLPELEDSLSQQDELLQYDLDQ